MPMTMDALLSLLRSVLKNENIPQIKLTTELIAFCSSQQLIGFLYYGIRNQEEKYSAQLISAVRQRYMASVTQQIQQDYYRDEIFKQLRNAQIPYMPLKGELLRHLYPLPYLRFSCDVDFLYPQKYREQVNSILKKFGFEHSKRESTNDSFMQGAVHIEPHFALNDQVEQYETYYADVWSHLHSGDGLLFHFTDEDFYINYLLHTYKHFILGGAGIRSVIDVWLFRKAHPSMDEEYLRSQFQQLKINNFVQQYERLGRVWFEEQIGDSDTNLLSKYLFDGGAYGTLEQGASIQLLQTGNKRTTRFRYFWNRVFLPYTLLRRQYPVLKKLPILMPFCQVARWLRVAFSKDRQHIYRDMAIGAGIDKQNQDDLRRVWEIIR